MMEKRNRRTAPKQKEPTIAPGMEMDELDLDASSEEIRKGDYTPVTKLYRDFVE
ncbi:hypothetical protein LOK74_05990 [Brevibacillus humidisoli]|uniref:hypothetical protein n=1 Tax=Brevibacillus humidisoli TaxID=2895522 RepID=UPI001E4E8254|nr:hypothetical protein [Brevibacillus humidisoli]UFJ43446.1 hypothetical protein LOK74_05990 [Brevibacillus humidisoli]